jgi:hypothetical protein
VRQIRENPEGQKAKKGFTVPVLTWGLEEYPKAASLFLSFKFLLDQQMKLSPKL